MLHSKKLSQTKGFTLIELLVVVSIISLLSSIVIASLNSARAKARDAKRREDMIQIRTAMEFYYDKYGTYLVTDPNTNTPTGYNPCGCGWFSYTDGGAYAVAIGQGLKNAGFLSANPHDPGGQDTGSVAGKTGYMLYPCANGFYIFAGLENPTAADTAAFNSAQACNNSLAQYGANYAIGHY